VRKEPKQTRPFSTCQGFRAYPGRSGRDPVSGLEVLGS
jgi:hypothetical protein